MGREVEAADSFRGGDLRSKLRQELSDRHVDPLSVPLPVNADGSQTGFQVNGGLTDPACLYQNRYGPYGGMDAHAKFSVGNKISGTQITVRPCGGYKEGGLLASPGRHLPHGVFGHGIGVQSDRAGIPAARAVPEDHGVDQFRHDVSLLQWMETGGVRRGGRPLYVSWKKPGSVRAGSG